MVASTYSDLKDALAGTGYVADDSLAMALHLAQLEQFIDEALGDMPWGS